MLECSDFNGHVGKDPESFNGVHGGGGSGSRNADRIRILDLCATANLVIENKYFVKPDSHLVTYQSGNPYAQLDYMLTRCSDLKQVQNAKVIGDGCVTQHKLLVCQINLRTQIRKQHKPPPSTKRTGSY